MPLSHLFISKHRKVDFDINLVIQDITNIPLVSGSYFVKWRLRNATHSTGVTTKEPIKDHTVEWYASVTTKVELVISKQHLLQPCELKLEIYKEVGGTGAGKQMGSLSINMSEYATSGPVTRRYLLEECKFNSFIKLAIDMKQVTNVDEPFDVPPLTKAHRQTDISVVIANTAPDKTDDGSIGKSNHLLLDYITINPPPTSHLLFVAHSVSGSTSDRSIHHQSSGIIKSQSTISLPQYCRHKPLFLPTDVPDPSDLVEELFAPKSDIETTSC
ncbi:N-terminal C2 in EEIG1 and EHBP1 proteins-domain-containing protein [Chlamydoabsidia padenii]|nr:N-terminal C2 in EEIG1 and EHBP1 proteins-domain-containing protein [Chlamydoabsidia padenii]